VIDGEQPVPADWRPVFDRIVHAFVAGDYALASAIDSVEPVPERDADRIARSVEDYGATLVDLTEETWETSVAQWTGNHWSVLVDLRTAEEGCSDLSLVAHVREVGAGHRFEVQGVWVE
jgi:hypothetical protein